VTPQTVVDLFMFVYILRDFVQAAERHAEAQAAVCEICTAKNVDRSFVDHFGVAVCWSCKKADVTDNYKLVSKTTARSDFLLTEKDFESEEGARVLVVWLLDREADNHRPGIHRKTKPKRLFHRWSDEVVHAASGEEIDV
jgi:hypothetical protein